MCDSNGYIYDPDGVDIKKVMDIKQKRRARISVYADEVPGSEYHEGRKGIWTLKCDIAMPCASQNEMDADDVQHLIDNGCMAVFEGANSLLPRKRSRRFSATACSTAPARHPTPAALQLPASK